MLTALTLGFVLAAPVPVKPETPPAGTPPRVMELKPDANGKVMVQVLRTEMQQAPAAVAGAVDPAGARPPIREQAVQVTKQLMVELSEVKDLTISTADGRKLDIAEGIKKLEKGGIVVISGDGKPVSPTFLKVFKDDTLVLVSPELAGGQQLARPAVGTRPGIRPLPVEIQPGGVQILPVPPPNAAPGGVIQIQIQGNVIQAVPAVPAMPLPAEKPVAKPPEK